jgi:O-antigen/teichoic acid export membrane protein
MIQKIINDTFVTAVIKLFSAFLKFLIILYITNTFGAEEFGAYMFAMTVFLLVNLIFRFGFDLYVQREVSVFLEDNKQKEGVVLLLNTILVSVAFMFIATIVAEIFLYMASSYIDSKKYSYMSLLLIFGVLHPIFWIISYYYRGVDRGKFSVINMEIIFPIIQIVLILIFYNFGYSAVYILVYSFILSLIACTAVYLYGIKDQLLNVYTESRFSKIDFSLNHVKKSHTFLMVSMTAIILSWSDILVISFFETNQSIGIYSVISKIGMVMMMPTSAVAIFFNNHVARCNARGDLEQIKKYAIVLTLLLFIVSLIGFSLINTFGIEILSFFGDEFRSAVIVLLIFTLAQLINATAGVFESIFIMTNMRLLFLKINLFMIIINIALNVPLVYMYGIDGAAIATLLSIVLARSVQFYYVKRKLI